MRYSHKEIESKQVVTESGTVLGRIHDVVYIDDLSTVLQYVVSGGLLRAKKVYHIIPSDIIEIQETEIIVADVCVRSSDQMQELPLSFSDPNPAMMREE